MGASACYHPDYTAPHHLTATSHTPHTTRPNGFDSSHPYPTQIGRDMIEPAQTPHSVPDPYFRSSPYTLSQTQAPSRDMVALKSTIPKESTVQDLDSADRCVLLDPCVLAHTVALLSLFPLSCDKYHIIDRMSQEIDVRGVRGVDAHSDMILDGL